MCCCCCRYHRVGEKNENPRVVMKQQRRLSPNIVTAKADKRWFERTRVCGLGQVCEFCKRDRAKNCSNESANNQRCGGASVSYPSFCDGASQRTQILLSHDGITATAVCAKSMTLTFLFVFLLKK